MRLRKPCKHDVYDAHWVGDYQPQKFPPAWCPGGEFLPEDALVIEKVEEAALRLQVLYKDWFPRATPLAVRNHAQKLLDVVIGGAQLKISAGVNGERLQQPQQPPVTKPDQVGEPG